MIVSHEILAPASPAQVAKAMADLAGSEVHIVYSARDLGRQLPAAWQESIKQGRRWSYRRFLRAAESGDPWFYRAFDLPSVLETWGAGLPPERIHVVTVPQPGVPDQHGDLLWLRFCEAFGIEPGWAPVDSDRRNRSLGIAETQVVRELNRRIPRATRRGGRLRRPDPGDARPAATGEAGVAPGAAPAAPAPVGAGADGERWWSGSTAAACT